MRPEEIETLLLWADHQRTSCSDDNPINGEPHDEQYSAGGVTFWGVRCSRCALLKAREKPHHADDLVISVEVSARWQEPCEHEWIPIRNEIIKSGELCTKCHAIRAEE